MTDRLSVTLIGELGNAWRLAEDAGLCSYCYDLSDITLEEGQYSSIPAECFTGCYNLKNIEIPEQIRVIDSSAFSFGGIRRVSFWGTGRLEEIGPNTFESTPLEEITIPSSVSRIGASAFQSCSSL